MILAGNHASHLDTALLLSSLPARIRHHVVVGAAADYFFDRHWKAALWAFALGAVPMERVKVNRRSADLAAALIEEGWSFVIFPEGGRSPDGWGQEFKGGAAYLAKRCSVPVVPVHLRGTRAILAKGSRRLRPGPTELRFGDPLWPEQREDARRFASRIERAVAVLADEAETDWWSARRGPPPGRRPRTAARMSRRGVAPGTCRAPPTRRLAAPKRPHCATGGRGRDKELLPHPAGRLPHLASST